MANFYVDLVNGNDTTGVGTIALPWKTLSKATAVGGARTIGDAVYVAKTPGSITLIGSGFTANNIATINTFGDLTGSIAVKDYISFNPSGFPVFQVSLVTSIGIGVVYYPWFEAGNDTGNTIVNIYKVPTIDTNLSTGNYDSLGVNGNEIANIRNTPYDTNLTYGYNILITGGWNSDFTLQDGYTLVKNTNPTAGGTAANFIRGNTGVDGYKMVRFGGLNFVTYYTGALSTENKMVYEDCIFGYTSTTTPQPAFFNNCKSYCGSTSSRFPVGSSTTSMFYYNTQTETNALRPAIYNHTHYLSYTEYSVTQTGSPAIAHRSYSNVYVKGLILKSCIRANDVVEGESNVGKFAIIPNAATGVKMSDTSVTKNANISIGLARIFAPSIYNSIYIDIDTTLLNSVMYSTTHSQQLKSYCYIKSTNGDIFSIPGTFKTSSAGDTGGVFPYCNNVVINNDNKKFQYDTNFISSVDNIVYSSGTNSTKVTKITNYTGGTNSYFIGDIELTNTSKTISVVCKGSKDILLTNLSALYYPVILPGSSYVPSNTTTTYLSGFNASTVAGTSATISSSSWTTLTLNLPSLLINTSGKIKLSMVVGGTNMVNGDSIWIDSITIS